MTIEMSISLPRIKIFFNFFCHSHIFRPPVDWGRSQIYFLPILFMFTIINAASNIFSKINASHPYKKTHLLF